MKSFKKILCSMVVMALLVSMLPINSYAAEYTDIDSIEGIYLTSLLGHYTSIGGNVSLYISNISNQQKQYINENCTWKSSDTVVATVDQSGHVAGKMYGKTTITATTKDGLYETSYDIIVYCGEMWIEKSELNLDVGDVSSLVVYCPRLDSITNDGLEDDAIATSVCEGVEGFEEEGLKVYTYTIKANHEGTTTFRVVSYNSGEVHTCKIIVGNSSPTPEPSPTPDPTPTPTPTPSSGTMDMYRLYNPYTGEHLYTSGTFEKDSLVSMGWNYEGVAWKAPETGNAVYRLYNPYSGEHHYTMHTSEKDYLVLIGWNYEGIGWYSSTLIVSVPVYRLFNPNSTGIGAHHYTTDSVERDQLVLAGWQDEGYAWYGQR